MLNARFRGIKKKIHRGKKKTKKIKLYYNNINGISSKTESLKEIVQSLLPDVVVLCETKLSKKTSGVLNQVFDEKQFAIIPRFTKAGKEGLAVIVKHNTFQSVLDVTSSNLNTIMTVRLSTGLNNIRLIVGYAPQEDDDIETREEFFQELELEITKCMAIGDIPLIVGDFNAKILPSTSSLNGTPVSENGKLLWDIVHERQLKILNFTDKCSGSITHVIRTTGASSVLDYMIAPLDLLDFIQHLQIDESTLYCPFRVIKRKKGNINKLSDHNAMILTMETPRVKKSKTGEKSRFNFCPKNLALFTERLETICATVTCGESAQNSYDILEAVTTDAMCQTLEQKQSNKANGFEVHKKFSHIAKKISKFAKKGKIQRRIARAYRQKLLEMHTDTIAAKNAENLVTSVQNLSENDRFSVQKFWRARKMMQKSPKSITSVHRDGGVEVFNDQEIVELYKEEFEDRLSSVEIAPNLTEYKDLTDNLYNTIIEQANKSSEPDFTMDELNQIIGGLKNGASGQDKISPKVFKAGGCNFRSFLLAVINQIKNEKKIPTQWENTNVIPLYKGKGSRKCLLNQRGIFLTQVVSKMWERLIKSRCQPALSRINKLQAGGAKGKSTADGMFLIRAGSCKIPA